MRVIPAPFYALVDTAFGDDPAVVVVNTALRNFAGRDAFPWHLRIGIACSGLGDNGMPTAEELEVVTRLELTRVEPSPCSADSCQALIERRSIQGRMRSVPSHSAGRPTLAKASTMAWPIRSMAALSGGPQKPMARSLVRLARFMSSPE